MNLTEEEDWTEDIIPIPSMRSTGSSGAMRIFPRERPGDGYKPANWAAIASMYRVSSGRPPLRGALRLLDNGCLIFTCRLPETKPGSCGRSDVPGPSTSPPKSVSVEVWLAGIPRCSFVRPRAVGSRQWYSI